MCQFGDGEYVSVNGVPIGYLWKTDVNSSHGCGGTMGSFYYEMNTLIGLSDDRPDLTMDSSDALSNIQTVIPSTTNSISVVFNDDSTGQPDNSTWLIVLAYGNGTTGINTSNHNALLNIFPNPVKDKLNVFYKDDNPSEIILYDITSRKLLHQKFTTTLTLGLEELANGVYLYEIRNKNGLINKGKVVKE
jgi:hypothetical protein